MNRLLILIILLFPLKLFSTPQFIETENRKLRDLKGEKVRVFGNKIFSVEKLLEIGKLSNKTTISSKDMYEALNRIEKFYLSKGYELVEITYLFLMGEWYVFINEGRIGKIIIKGENTINTLVLKNVFVLRENIFNSIELKALIESVKKNYGFQRIQYRLLPVDKDKKTRFDFAERITGFVRSESEQFYIEPSYDLLIIVKKKEWGDGIGGFIDYNSFGLVGGISYTDSSLITSGDRFKGVLKGGINYRTNLDDKKSNLVFTLGALDINYFPSFMKLRYFKPNIELIISDTSYMRGDIPLNEYRIFSGDISVFAGFELKKQLILSYGFGEEYLFTHDFDYVESDKAKIDEIRLFRSYMSLTLNYLIDEPSLRTDLQNRLKTRVRYYIPADNQSHWLFSIDYNKNLIFGYDYLKFVTGLKLLTGDIPFFDEFSIAYSSFKASFSDSYYARDSFYLSFEYDLSIYKDILHLATFLDFTTIYYKSYKNERMYYLGAIDGGAGLRILILDMFLIKLDYVEALAFNNHRDRLFLFSAGKVF